MNVTTSVGRHSVIRRRTAGSQATHTGVSSVCFSASVSTTKKKWSKLISIQVSNAISNERLHQYRGIVKKKTSTFKKRFISGLLLRKQKKAAKSIGKAKEHSAFLC